MPADVVTACAVPCKLLDPVEEGQDLRSIARVLVRSYSECRALHQDCVNFIEKE